MLTALREVVPTIVEENGMESRERHLRCDDDPKRWDGREELKGAAKMLEIGELEAAIKGAPPVASEAWRRNREIIETDLHECIDAEEVTQGAEELSRRGHAREALDLLRYIDFTTSFLRGEMDSEEDRDWMNEAIAEVANLAFEAGRHTQVAWGKEFEELAAIRAKQTHTLAHKNEGRRTYNAERTAKKNAWIKHAELVEASLSRDVTGSARAEYILKNWRKIGVEGQRPAPPSKKTLENWISERKKKKASRTRS
ncbi:hypothetical protein DDZ14_13630 [Maritimibacter sp. 55A14]|nr:hypothetical protein DDZ14_13630 [Maritimibacter sp. 55A14]